MAHELWTDYDPVKALFFLLSLTLFRNNHFNAFISALKPFIAESKLIAELSEKFVMINVEVRHSFVDYEHKFCWYVEFLLRTNEHRNLRKLKCLILSHTALNTTIFFFCTFCRTTKNPRMTSLMWMANTSLESFSWVSPSERVLITLFTWQGI